MSGTGLVVFRVVSCPVHTHRQKYTSGNTIHFSYNQYEDLIQILCVFGIPSKHDRNLGKLFGWVFGQNVIQIFAQIFGQIFAQVSAQILFPVTASALIGYQKHVLFVRLIVLVSNLYSTYRYQW